MPADVDVFLLMEDTFDASRLTGEARFLFDHSAAQARFGASVFWRRRLPAWEGEVATIDYWQVKRGGSLNATLERIRCLQAQVAHLRTAETNPVNYHLSASGFLAEIDKSPTTPFAAANRFVLVTKDEDRQPSDEVYPIGCGRSYREIIDRHEFSRS